MKICFTKDAAKNAGYQLVGGLNKHHLDNFHAFYKTVANIVGTTAKTFIMTGSVVKLLNMFFGNPRWVLGITMVVTMSTGQLAQFSILGKNDTIQLFEQVMLGSMDSAVVGGLVYGLMHYGFQMSSSFNVGMTVFNMTLLAESIHILRNNLAFSAYGYQKIRTCFFDQTTLIRSSSAQELGFSPIVPTARFSEKMIARISSILGYALPNALLYFFNDVWFNMYIKSCWEGQCNNGLKSNLEMLEKDLLIISACITTALLLLVSNSRSYEGRILDLFLKMRGTKTPGHAIEAEHTAEKSSSLC
ncbi:MAG: hypothetical protein HWD59_06575 [Coxiellaceae bacterium]|nr:MAG: hypothetical protein HWD59_06575 [Coxiellaceae bacterium]